MSQVAATSGFHYDSDGSNASDESSFGPDPLGVTDTHQSSKPRQEATNGTTSDPPVIDFTEHAMVRIRYQTTQGTTQEGVYKLSQPPLESQSHRLELTLLPDTIPTLDSNSRGKELYVTKRSKNSQSEMNTAHNKHPNQQTNNGDPVPSGDPGAGPSQPGNEIDQEEKEPEMELVDNKGWRIAIRQYQLMLYRAACRRNVIAYLDTGAGKTFISVLLIRDIANRNAKDVAEGSSKKYLFFLVPRKVLVFQQADVIKQFTDLTVTEHSGDRFSEDVWDKATWEHHLQRSDVAVMTPQILLNLLRQQFVRIQQIALIVFDECHHARKKAPYNSIMQEFYHPAKASRLRVPKIFGMTASLVTKKRSTEEVYNSFYELENNLDSMIMTANREAVQKHATSANELDVNYTVNTTETEFPVTFRLLEKASVRMTISNKLALRHKSQKGARGTQGWQVDSKKHKGPLDLQIRQIGNVSHVISVMGLLAGCYALMEIVDVWHDKEKKTLHSWNFPSANATNIHLSELDERYPKHSDIHRENLGTLAEVQYRSLCDLAVAILSGLYKLEERTAREHFTELMKGGGGAQSVRQVQVAVRRMRTGLDLSPLDKFLLKVTMNDLQSNPDQEASLLTSHRMQQLLRVLTLEKDRIPEKERAHWRGMIFVQQTLMAIALEHVLSLHSEMSFFKCQSLTGHNASIMAAAMEDRHQRMIVEMFRKGRVNLLICTSVAEEGLDITQCSMVVRFDLPFTEASYIQSRGRARKPGSSYVLFVNSDAPDEGALVENIRFAEQCMKDFAAYRQQQEDIADDEDIFSGTQDAYLEISQKESTAIVAHDGDGNEIAGLSAIEMIHKYVGQLPQDEYCQLTPHLIFRSQTTDNRQEFQYQLTLPLNAAITRPILGEWCPSKQKAKRSACYVACIELRALGELNQKFYPVSHKDQTETRRKKIKVNEELLSVETPIDPDALRPIHSTKKLHNAERLSQGPSGAQSKERFVLYLTLVTLNPSIDSIMGQFGLLTLKRLDCLASFPLFTETNDVKVDFSDCGEVLVSAEQLADIKKYHLAILEALYFRTKLFTTVCRESKADLGTEINQDLDYLPEQLKAEQDKIPYVNQSWYLLCPIRPVHGSTDRFEDPTFKSDDDEDWSLENEQGLSHMDWETVRRTADRLDHIHTPGILKLHDGLESLEYGEILMSPYNTAAYKLVGVRRDLNLNSAFPSRPNPEFYDPSVTKEYKGSYVPNRSGAQYDTFAEYYKGNWKFDDIEENQPLLECVGFKQLSIVKKAKNLINPSWRQTKETEPLEETLDDWNVAVHLVPQLVVLYPLNYKLWKSLSYVVAICWKVESMVKVAELRDELFTAEIERSISPPDIAMLYESVTSKSCQEHCTYERLEFIGDAILKYISSLYCYFKYPNGHEGVLTMKRIDFICNRHLAQTAIHLGLQKYIRAVQLGDHPWRPAGCQFLDAYWLKMGKSLNKGNSWFGGRTQKASQENQMHQSKICHLTIKQVADVVEALLGACLVYGDIPCVCALMDRLGLFDSDASCMLSVLKDKEKSERWLDSIRGYMQPELEGLEELDQMRRRQFEHGRALEGLEEALNYHFECPCFALEALTHCSWPHADPPCYQRLEYLGDAVLDIMIVTHYYTNHGDLDPGQLTLLRSASVNNDRLAATAVKTEAYKYILHFSAYLQSHVAEYLSGYSGADDRGAPKVLGDIVESLIGRFYISALAVVLAVVELRDYDVGATYLDLHGDLKRTWEIWSPLLQPFYTPETVPVHPVVELTQYCISNGIELEFFSSSTSTDLEAPSDSAIIGMHPFEDDNDEDEDDWEFEKLCGKQALMQMEGNAKSKRITVQVKVNGKLVGEGEGTHAKAAKRQAAMVALQSRPWDLS